ncbi:MAG: hypothetical protein K8H85_09645 [Cyclobacteriaceae bacterium]|nr:hypothetical protein [Cyclobacteriaceae bacterium]
MILKEILLTTDFTLNISYSDVKDILKKKLNNNFFKGYFDKEDSVLYYRSDFMTIPGLTKIPVIQVKFEKGINSEDLTKIEFKIVTPLLIIIFLAIATLWTIYFFNVDGLRQSNNGLIVPVFGTLFFYGLIFVRYTIELSYFKDELKKWE